jgi:hypothetical protein
MTGDLLPEFLSRDPQRIWAAAGAVMRCWDRAALRRLAVRAADIRAATDGIDLGGALRPNATHLAFALRKIAFAEGDACLCGLYPDYDMFAPAREAAEARVVVSSERFDDGTGHYTCRCCACGQGFAVREETGYHYPWYVWEVTV